MSRSQGWTKYSNTPPSHSPTGECDCTISSWEIARILYFNPAESTMKLQRINICAVQRPLKAEPKHVDQYRQRFPYYHTKVRGSIHADYIQIHGLSLQLHTRGQNHCFSPFFSSLVLSRMTSSIHLVISITPASLLPWMFFLVGISLFNASDRQLISFALLGFVRKSAGFTVPLIFMSLIFPFSTVC